VCAVAAVDADKDGHATTACKQMPGDDCNDANKTVFPSAPELCDRLDNDCDGKADLDDGLSLSNSPIWVGRDVDKDVVGEGAVAAWSPSSKLYGIFWRLRGLQDLVVALYDANGARKAGPTTVGRISADVSTQLAIAPGDTGFGIAWNTEGSEVQFRTVSGTGTLGDSVVVANREGTPLSPLALAWSATGQRWDIAADHGLGSVTASGPISFVHRLNKDLAISGLELRSVGDRFVLAASGTIAGSPSSRVYFYRGDRAFDVNSRYDYASANSAATVHLAARSDGALAIAAVIDSTRTAFTLLDGAGTKTCNYTEPAAVATITGTTTGYTLATSGSLGDSNFREISTACQAGPLIVAYPGGVANHRLVASATTYLSLRDDKSLQSYYSVFGSNFCN
jgi:hypothetical protein